MSRVPPRGPVAAVLALLVALAIGAAGGSSAAAAPAKVPCTAIGHGKYECTFDEPGDGRSGGSPVQASSGAVVGYLHQGRNYVFCNAVGRRVTKGKYHNVVYGWTIADDGRYGWVNAVHAHGGANDGGYGGGTPSCGTKHGSAPGATKPAPPPPASAGPTPATCKAAGHGRFNCFFYPAGDGSGSGTKVIDARRHVVGWLHQGVNYVSCQAAGGEVKRGQDQNRYWAWTDADNGAHGWVNALDASGGDNDGPFGGGTPSCGRAHGAAPGGAAVGAPAAPTPPPTPAPAPSPTTDARRAAIVRLALREQRKHFRSHNDENPYGERTAWCSNFVTWVWKHSGVPIDIYAFSGEVYSWGLRNTYTRPPTSTPRVGDAIEFGDTSIREPWNAGTGGSTHVGLVSQVFPKGKVMTINGNFFLPGSSSVTGIRIQGPFDPGKPGQTRRLSGSGYPAYGFVSPVDDRGAGGSRAATSRNAASGGGDLVPTIDRRLAAKAAAAQDPKRRPKGAAPPAYVALPYARRGVRITAVDATASGRIVLRVRYRGSRRTAHRVLSRVLHRYHDRASHYRVRYARRR